ncbi:MAG: OmpA family protein [Alphaproteobacteria bacterium]|nr:OmpA family protein [Alphaproteobacteria bacterium]
MEETGRQSHWIPLSDLMTGLMMVFLLIAVAFMLRVQESAKVATEMATQFEGTKSDLNQALQEEFKDDLRRWNAEILADLTVRFRDPEVLFTTGNAQLRERFRDILFDFFPRYVAILYSEKYRATIKEIRIEGHTSSSWANARSPLEAYLKNMELSQARTRTALEFLLRVQVTSTDEQWLRTRLTANGLSSAHPIVIAGIEDQVRSQRVEFRVVTNAEERMDAISKAAVGAL